MAAKKYASYAEIEHDLKILKLEREIYQKKVVLSLNKTKESFLPSKSVSLLGDIYSKLFSGTIGSIVKLVIPYVINWYINRKRGD
ncbi:DUF6327 family protein [Flavobacterium sp. 25HG05S-40]|uniref:DUF6327 family protein n=1 Tax=Flavobacterium sp. 25HG05S-40 TaxID=3458682 RepID=UPI00404464CB